MHRFFHMAFLLVVAQLLFALSAFAEPVQESKKLLEVKGEPKTVYLVRDIDALEHPYNYTIGGGTYLWIEILGALMIGAAAGGALLHGVLLFVSRKRRSRLGSGVLKPDKKDRIYPLIIRLGHWTNAICIITLLISGFIMHYHGPGFFWGHLHNYIGVLLLFVYALFLLHEFMLFDIRQFVPTVKDLTTGAFKQAKFYLIGIFKGDEHPFHTTAEARLRPLQKIAYFGMMFLMMPFVVVSGALLVNPVFFAPIVGQLGMENMRYIFALHLLSAFGVLYFLIIHLYMILTGETVSQHIMTMITGDHQGYRSENS